MIVDEDDYLAHIGVARRSGRYPWGSGENPNQRNKTFLSQVEEMRKQGLSEKEIAESFGISIATLRNKKSIEKNAQRAADAARAFHLKNEVGMSNMAIAREMDINESSVRSLLNPALNERRQIIEFTADRLREKVDRGDFLDVGVGTELHVGVSDARLKAALTKLEEEGYTVTKVQVDQLGTGAGKKTTVRVLAPPGTTYADIKKNEDKIKSYEDYAEFSPDGGRTAFGILPPLSVSSNRLKINYEEDGGADADGVIYVRPGVDDVSLGGSRYAQVRVAIDGTHYLKGMAVYKDDLPDGVDLAFNTNKSKAELGDNKLKALKPMKSDPDNPFGSAIRRQLIDRDPDGNERVTSAMNLVNEEGSWYDWSSKLSSQMLSKQRPQLVKEQLELTYGLKKAEYDEIMSLTNPAVRKKLLDAYADGADSAAEHLKAAGLPRTRNHVILPINSLKDDEVYAPFYRDGEKVVLIRHPHGGKFEIPELTVNNRNPEGRKVLGAKAPDAIGINSKVAQRLSGADFDGDSVLVIPNNSRKVSSESPLAELKDFDPRLKYPGYAGMKPMSAHSKQRQMGDVSNLITDMTIMGAPNSEIAKAVKHSMVVIDAEKHNLNWKQSAKDNSISQLKEKYQGRSNAGASTLISRASSEQRVPKRKPGPIDPATGKRTWRYAEPEYDAKGNLRTPVKSTKMAETDDAFTLVSSPSGTPVENLYATHANRMKALANQARKASLETPPIQRSTSAAKTYAKEVESLNSKLDTALRNSPRERQAQILAKTVFELKRQDNPSMPPDEVKRTKGQALLEARRRTGADKQAIRFTQEEWNAVQAGAISNHRLEQILNNADLDSVKALATPRTRTGVPTAALNRARSMLNSGYTQSEVADALGYPATTIQDALNSGAEGS